MMVKFKKTIRNGHKMMLHMCHQTTSMKLENHIKILLIIKKLKQKKR